MYAELLKKTALISLDRSLGFPTIKPYKLNLIVTYRCNSRCRTCNIWKVYLDDPKKASDELKTDEIQQVLKSVKDDLLWLNLTGGEPTLRADLTDLITYASEECRKLSVINFPTNGLTPEKTSGICEEIINSIRKDLNLYLTVSIDGPPEVHDDIRGVKGAFSRAIETFNLVKAIENRNLHVGFQFTLSKYNIQVAYDFVKQLVDMGPLIVTVAHRAELFKNIEAEDVIASPEKMASTLRQIYKVFKSFPSNPLQSLLPRMYVKFAVQYVRHPNEMVLPCASSYATCTIDPYGKVRPCPYMSAGEINVRGNGYDLGRIVKLPGVKSIRELVKRKSCPNCWMNCEAYPTIIQQFPRAVLKFISS